MDRMTKDLISEISKELQLSDYDLAAALDMTPRFLNVLREKAAINLPGGLIKLVRQALGPDRAKRLEQEYDEQRASIDAVELRKLEEKYSVPGAGYFHPGAFK